MKANHITNNIRSTLTNIANIILNESSSTSSLHNALNDFSEICCEISGITPEPCFTAWSNDSLLDNGVAISPQAAAYCISDYQRSVVFIRGVNAAIKAAQTKFKRIKLKILYAGCGPFATQVLPLLINFNASDFELTLLDIHQESLDSVEILFQHLGFSAYKLQLVKADACDYQPQEKQHIIIVETMQKALEQEPQVQVTNNLSSFVVSDGFFIPERIDVSIALINFKVELELFKKAGMLDSQQLILAGKRHLLGQVFSLQANDIQKQTIERITPFRHKYKPVIIALPDIPDIKKYKLALLTYIKVYRAHQLSDYECDLTLPSLCNASIELKNKQVLSITYHLGKYPIFDIMSQAE